MNLWIIGYPKPPDTAAEISAKPAYAINCNVHGNEASGRESCFTMARQLVSTQDPATLAILSKITVLMDPVDQSGRPRGQHPRQQHRAGPQPRPRLDRAGRDQGHRGG